MKLGQLKCLSCRVYGLLKYVIIINTELPYLFGYLITRKWFYATLLGPPADFSRFMNVVSNLRYAAGSLGHTVSTPWGFQGQSPCKSMPIIVSDGLETCISCYLVSSYDAEHGRIVNLYSKFSEQEICFSKWINYFLKMTFQSFNNIKAYAHYFLSNIYFSPNDSTSKTVKNPFLFHLKISFHSQDIQIFVFSHSHLFQPLL